ncbi:MAG: metal-dependent transcriptional regulator [Limisphaerales bacterium]
MKVAPDHPDRVLMEDALKHLHEWESQGRTATMESAAGALGVDPVRAAAILSRLRERHLLTSKGAEFGLNEDGRLYAVQILRTHRLYETWLARETSVPATEWHRQAHAAEHSLPSAAVDALADRLNNPRFDPHGDPIPTREGLLPPAKRIPLDAWPAGQAALIDHIEDEPEGLFRRIEALGLRPGMVLRSRPTEAGSFELRVEGRQVDVVPELAGMIHLTSLPEDQPDETEVSRLSTLRPGGRAVIRRLSPACGGAERRRLLDLGLVPGTPIRCEFSSPFGSPVSYLVRGALIALRREQAERILIESPVPVAGSETQPNPV